MKQGYIDRRMNHKKKKISMRNPKKRTKKQLKEV